MAVVYHELSDMGATFGLTAEGAGEIDSLLRLAALFVA